MQHWGPFRVQMKKQSTAAMRERLWEEEQRQEGNPISLLASGAVGTNSINMFTNQSNPTLTSSSLRRRESSCSPLDGRCGPLPQSPSRSGRPPTEARGSPDLCGTVCFGLITTCHPIIEPQNERRCISNMTSFLSSDHITALTAGGGGWGGQGSIWCL